MPLETRVYQKENQLKLGVLLKSSFKDLLGSHFLARQLATRDIKSQYRQSYLGLIWVFINPLTSAFVWIFLNYTGTIKLTDTGVPYPIYAMSGTLIWSIITEAIKAPMQSTRGAKGLLSKINFPKEALVLTGIYKLLFNSGIKVLLLLVLLVVFGVDLHISILFFPLAILVAIVFGTTLGLFLTPIAMIYNDVFRIITMGMGLLMYVTPVVYAIPKSGMMRTIMELNPFTAIILTSRQMVLGQPLEYLGYFGVIALVSMSLFFIGLIFYRIAIPVIVER
ncbi:ABC transporter permease [Aestuariibaculum marinum]|uniref:Transport permease protein n=1 Tax=Aestuariibaculum marinum TaxID=2683592 RepID=A0A8J6Q1G5_9FLAO|nr:ABC transporter permease [Aestuariibaculum marinum]MBD0823862.1 ABC transporter permease [Aestuariibaculum marinum]